MDISPHARSYLDDEDKPAKARPRRCFQGLLPSFREVYSEICPSWPSLKATCARKGFKRDRKIAPFISSRSRSSKLGQIGNTEAEVQNLNNASQALHNMYLLMKEAAEEELFSPMYGLFLLWQPTLALILKRCLALSPSC